jgi:hypothetical protein
MLMGARSLVTFKDEWLLYTKSSRAIWQQPGTWA